jgi:hypothetical protein
MAQQARQRRGIEKTLAKARIHKHLGSLQTADRKSIAAVLRRIAAA